MTRGRRLALAGALTVIVLLGALTLYTAVRNGVDVLVIISLVILALLGFGVVGALTADTDE